ncbi:hypothetical protein AeMF1_005901 [Aphanomyces euteiches]|nr:hypothetical protein AeMF1_005901 [Aphanomyces euteiches]KAH9187474.1 hypothetical protein AeNC1_010550 [Aphanomyces euteiches]
MLMPHFGFSKVREFVDIFARNARQLSYHLKQVADQGVAVDMHDFFTKMTLDVIGVAAFGYNFGSLESANDSVLQAYNMLNQPPKLFYLLGSTYIPGFANWPLPRLVKQREAKRILHEKVANVIESKLQARRDPSRPIDLVDLMHLDTLAGHLSYGVNRHGQIHGFHRGAVNAWIHIGLVGQAKGNLWQEGGHDDLELRHCKTHADAVLCARAKWYVGERIAMTLAQRFVGFIHRRTFNETLYRRMEK